MDAAVSEAANLGADEDFDKAFELLVSLVDFRQADERMPLSSSAVFTASVVLWLLVYQRLNQNASLQVAVNYLLDNAEKLCPNNKRVREGKLSRSTAAYSKGRTRLPLEVTEWFAGTVSQSLIETAPPTLEGRRLFILDGTTITLAPEKELRKAFPPATNQHGPGVWPVALLMVAHELESGAALLPEIGPMYGPKAVSEASLAGTIMARLPEQSIVMADANFGIFSVAYSSDQHRHSFLLRMTDVRFQSHLKKATLMAEGPGWKTWSLSWRPTAHDRRTNRSLPQDALVQTQLHEIVVHEKLTLLLATDLPLSAQAAASLYLRRGEVETDISNIKVVLDTEAIRATTITMFKKELLIAMVAYNLVVQFRRQAARAAQVPPKRLSFTNVWSLYRQFLMSSFFEEPAVWRERFERALYYAQRAKLPNRPGRNYDRAVYPRRPKSTHFKKRTPPPDDPEK